MGGESNNIQSKKGSTFSINELKDGEVKQIPTEDLFKNPLKIAFPKVGNMEVYPNRDSLPYVDLYGIPETNTLYRGTFRYEGWCEALDALKMMLIDSKFGESGTKVIIEEFLTGYEVSIFAICSDESATALRLAGGLGGKSRVVAFAVLL